MRSLLALLVLSAVVAPAAFGHSQATHSLVATVGKNDGFTISLTLNGKRVTHLPAGTYTIVVHDDSSIHNFEIEREHGGKSRDLTDVDFVGTRTVRVALTRGSYKAYCDPHESTMFQDFAVR
jgi:hypothetical protein